MLSNYNLHNQSLEDLPNKAKLLINTLNAHSYNIALQNPAFEKALLASDVLLPDGVSVVWAEAFLNKRKIKKIAGADIFKHEMQRLNAVSGSCFFLGSSKEVLGKIIQIAALEYPNVKIATHSPPFKPQFTTQDTQKMLDAVNTFGPEVLFIGMTAPKQEIWAHQNFKKIQAKRVVSIGAVFDFYAKTVKRAPQWLIFFGLEWLYRLLKEPKRMWKRYLIGNTKFIWQILKGKFKS
jgi:N-acetylglucosaminyldiphosphoundecaprenol N-acetyl-beta-D-mannosaminyltransferase